MTTDLCKLTKKRGRFARSHLLPKALTRLSLTGERLVEVGIGEGIKKRFDSWFDLELCTHEGEKILADIDTKAIRILRENFLIWGSWGTAEKLQADFDVGTAEEQNIRQITIKNAPALQLFFLSLLWRAAATNRAEFKHVQVAPEILEDIRLRVLNKNIGQVEDYPVHLYQVTTIGVKHNRVPLSEEVNIATDDDIAERNVPFVRFYFDGLVALVYLFKDRTDGGEHNKVSLCGRADGKTLVFGNPFENSRVNDNIKTMVEIVNEEEKNGPTFKSQRVQEP